MQYLGGKSRIAKPTSQIINRFSFEKNFISLFCGSCSIESLVVAKAKTCNDLHPYLISMFQAIQKGWEIPQMITKSEYENIKSN